MLHSQELEVNMFCKSGFFLAVLYVVSALAPNSLHCGIFDWGSSLSARAERARTALDGYESEIEQALIEYNVPGVVVGIVVDGDVVWSKGFGYRDLEDQLPMSSDTLVAVGSITKGFTSFLMGMMTEEGLLYWDQRVIDLIPEFRLWDQYATQNLTLRDLLTHRSGMPRHDFMWYNSKMSRGELMQKLRYLQPTCDIRERYNYNNMMYTVAGVAMERVGKRSWEELIAHKILKPLGMNDTNFSVDAMKQSPNAAFPYVERGSGGIRKMNYRDVTTVGPAGSMNSTVNDLNHWLRMLLANGVYNEFPFISQATLQEIQAPQVIISGYPENEEAQFHDYGLGWEIVSYRGHYYVSHDGGIDGFTSVISLLPQDNIGLVVVANKNLTNFSRYLSFDLMDKVLELPSKKWLNVGLEQVQKGRKAALENKQKEDYQKKPGTTPTHAMTDYAGKYDHPGYGTVEVECINGRLQATLHGITSLLDHWHYDIFSVIGESEDMLISREGSKYTFRNNVSGEIADLVIPYESNAPDIVFKKRPNDQFSNLEYFRKYIGPYEVYGVIVDVVIRDHKLLAIIPGQPIFELLPVAEDEFVVKSMSHYSVRFVHAADGSIEEALLILPYGAFSATPVR